jgi:hypothetical protein
MLKCDNEIRWWQVATMPREQILAGDGWGICRYKLVERNEDRVHQVLLGTRVRRGDAEELALLDGLGAAVAVRSTAWREYVGGVLPLDPAAARALQVRIR